MNDTVIFGQGMDSGYPAANDETTVMSTVASTPPSVSVIGRMTAAVGRLWRGSGVAEAPVEASSYGQGRGQSSSGGSGDISYVVQQSVTPPARPPVANLFGSTTAPSSPQQGPAPVFSTPQLPAYVQSTVSGPVLSTVVSPGDPGTVTSATVQSPTGHGKAHLKLEKYDGKAPLETFLVKFENCAKYYGWSPMERVCHLTNSLVGAAAEVTWQMPADATEQQIVALLKQRYGTENQKPRFAEEMKVRRLKSGETLQDLYLDIRRLLALSFPGEVHTTPAEQMGMNCFLSALNNPAVLQRVMDRGPKTLDEAYAIVSHMSVYSPVLPEQQRSASTYGSVRNRVHNIQTTDYEAVPDEVQSSRSEAERRRMRYLEQELQEQKQLVQQLTSEMQYYRGRSDGQSQSQMNCSDQQQPHSYCQPEGQQPESRSRGFSARGSQYSRRRGQRYSRGRGGQDSSSAEGVVCYNCQRQGHVARNCPGRMEDDDDNPPTRSAASQPSTRSSAAGVSDLMSDYETYIEIDVNGVKIPVLLDTGCDRVLVPRRVVPDADLSPTTVELFAANGSRIDVLGIMRLRFTINHRIMYVDALVSNDIAETIFGFQFLRKYDCKWHFTKNLLEIGSMCVPLKHRRGTANLRRVYVIEKTTVAPSSCVNIPVELPMCNLRVPIADWLVESKEIKPGIVVARTLLDPENKNAAVRCVNLSSKEYVLKPGFHIGDAEPGTVRSDEEAKPYLDCCLNQINACFGQPDLDVQAMNVCDSTVADSDSLTGDQLASKPGCSDSSAIPLQPLRSSASYSLRSEQCDHIDTASCVNFSCSGEVGLPLTESFSISFSESSEGMVDACILKRDTVDVVNQASVYGSNVVDIKSVECGSADVCRCSVVSAVSSDGNEMLHNAMQVNGDETTFKRLETVNFDHLQPIIDNLPDDLTDNERVRAIDLLHRYADVFGQHDFDIGYTNLVVAEINTDVQKPIAEPVRRQARVHLDAIDNCVGEMLKAGVCEPASSPWNFNIVVVDKKNSVNPRITVDYRKLNAVTRKDKFPLPSIQECFDALAYNRFYAALDQSSSFYQIPIKMEDRDKTAFSTRRGQFRYRTLAMGLSNSPSIFARLMSLVMRGLIFEKVLVFIDDTLVLGKDFDDHLHNLELVFERFRKSGLKLKPKKCRIFLRRAKFLGHVVSERGVEMDPDKVACIIAWEFPKDVSELRSFMGLASYYRSYIKDFAHIAEPLLEMMRKGCAVVVTDHRLEAFNELKRRLSEAPILGVPQDQGRYILQTDASNFAAGCILAQVQEGKERVLEYASRTFNKAERNYCITRKEMAAVLFGLKHFRTYLLGQRFTIRTDHMAIKHYQTAPSLGGQQQRYLDYMSYYDFDVEYRPGKLHTNADAVSRMPPCEINEGEPCKQCHKRVTGVHVNTVATRARNKNRTVVQQHDEVRGDFIYPGQGRKIRPKERPPPKPPDDENWFDSGTNFDFDDLKSLTVPPATVGQPNYSRYGNGHGQVRGDTGTPATTVSQNNSSSAECGRRVCFSDNDIVVDDGTKGYRRCDTVPKRVLFSNNANVGHENLEYSSGTSPGLHANQYVPDYDEFPPLESSTNLSPLPKGHIPDSALGLEQGSFALVAGSNNTATTFTRSPKRRNLSSVIADSDGVFPSRRGPANRRTNVAIAGNKRSSNVDNEVSSPATTTVERELIISTPASGRPGLRSNTRVQRRDDTVDAQRVSGSASPKMACRPNAKAKGQRNTRLEATNVERIAPEAVKAANEWTDEYLRDCQMRDPDIALVFKAIDSSNGMPSWDEVKAKSPALRQLYNQYESLVTRNGVLYRVFHTVDGGIDHLQLVLPSMLKKSFLSLIHNDAAGHLKLSKTLPHVQRRAWWSTWRRDTQLFIQCCSVCEAFHRGKTPRQGHLRPMIMGAPMERWSIDLCGPFPTVNGYKYLFTAIDPFSKFAIVVPIRSKTADVVAKTIVQNIFLKYGLCFEILTDQGSEFENDLAYHMYRLLGIKKLRTSSYEPRTNGVVESFHRVLNAMLAKVVKESQRDWPSCVAYVTFVYNSTPHSATSLPPFLIIHGRLPLWHIDLLMGEQPAEPSTVPEYVGQITEHMRQAEEIAREHLQSAAETSKAYYARKVKPASFIVGDRVRVYSPRKYVGKTPKWQSFYREEGIICKKLNDLSYVIKCPQWRQKRIIHVDKLKLIKEY